jgi:hypothetical protein
MKVAAKQRPQGVITVRTFAIWLFGLLAAMIIGGVLGSIYDNTYNQSLSSAAPVVGAIGMMCIFACLRLWIASK